MHLGVRRLLFLLMGVLTTSHAAAFTVASPSQGAATFSQLPRTVPQLSKMMLYLRMLPELSAYLDNPETECTIIAPDNAAIEYALDALGKYVGLLLQNATIQEMVMNYHVIPGKRIKAEEIGTSTSTALTRANQTVWFTKRDGQPYVSFKPQYIIPLEVVNIRSGNCIVHTISKMLLIPPVLYPTFEQWLTDAGHMPAPLPRSEWVADAALAPGAIEALTQSSAGAAAGANSKPAVVAAGTVTEAAASVPAGSNGAAVSGANGGSRAYDAGRWLLMVTGAIAAAGLL